MLDALLTLAQPLPAPTLAEVERMGPERVGETVLGALAKGPVVDAFRKREVYITAPGQTDYELVEAAEPVSGGCVRRRWTVTFQAKPGQEPEDGVVVRKRFETEVARKGLSCEAADYAVVDHGLAPDRALRLLQALDRLGTGKDRARFDCSAEFSALCARPETARTALRATPVWKVSESDGLAQFDMGEWRSTYVSVRLSPGRPARVSIFRSTPPPF